MESPPRFLRPTAAPAERAIVVGDPGRALFLAQELIETPPPMFNHHRGLWGYSGAARSDDRPLIVQGTGLGATSLNAVVEDLVSVGVERFVRVGTCESMHDLSVGELLVVTEAIGGDGVSSRLAAAARLKPDRALTEALIERLGSATATGVVRSGDLGHGHSPRESDEVAADLATASLFATATHRGVRSAAVLVAARARTGELDDEALQPLVLEAGSAAAAALAAA